MYVAIARMHVQRHEHPAAQHGAIMGGNADTDRASITLRTLSDPDKLGPALAILRDILSSPRFDADILNREKNRTIASIKDARTVKWTRRFMRLSPRVMTKKPRMHDPRTQIAEPPAGVVGIML